MAALASFAAAIGASAAAHHVRQTQRLQVLKREALTAAFENKVQAEINGSSLEVEWSTLCDLLESHGFVPGYAAKSDYSARWLQTMLSRYVKNLEWRSFHGGALTTALQRYVSFHCRDRDTGIRSPSAGTTLWSTSTTFSREWR